MKKNYQQPTIQIVKLYIESPILSASGGASGSADGASSGSIGIDETPVENSDTQGMTFQP